MENVIFLVLILSSSCLAFDNQGLLDLALNPKKMIQNMIVNRTRDFSLCQIHAQIYFEHILTATDLLPQNSWALKSKYDFDVHYVFK